MSDVTAEVGAELAPDRWVEYVPIESLLPADRNAKAHDDELIGESLGRFGFIELVVLDERTGKIISGHGRREALLARKAAGLNPPRHIKVADDGTWLAPINRGWASRDEAEATAAGIALNRIGERGGWHRDVLAEMLDELGQMETTALGFEPFEGIGFDGSDIEGLLLPEVGPGAAPPETADPPPPSPTLADRFLVPPFSVLDARQGYWQERKRAWLGMGIRSEEGRAQNLLKMSEQVSTSYGQRGNSGAYGAQAKVDDETGNLVYEAVTGLTSIFDPVLCELAYRWWAPADAKVLDPFAGGSVRGIVAAALGLEYVGVDLRPEQVASNIEQLAAMELPGNARWVVGDSRTDIPAEPVDFVFSCPPYFDLEQYSDDERDLSNAKDYDDFLEAYWQIIIEAVARLKDDRFACFVVGDIRDKQGLYRGFVPTTIAAFRDAGCSFYNDAILVTAVGSLALRAGRIFTGGRKLGKAHQNVLVFCKGDPKRAAAACAPVEDFDLAELFGTLLTADDAKEAESAPEPEASGSPAVPDGGESGSAEAKAPAWAKGLPVPRLKEAAALWKQHDKGLILGAFTATKEATLAEWVDKGDALLYGDGETLRAGAQIVVASSGRALLDFRGKPVGAYAAGDLLIRHPACERGWEVQFAERLAEIAAGARAAGDHNLWMEVWQEHPLDRWLVDLLGLAYFGTKVRASSELVGIWGPASKPSVALGAMDFYGLVRMEGFGFDPEALAAEVRAAEVAWADHYAVYNKGSSWSAVCLRGYGGDPNFIIKPAEMSKQWKKENAEKMAWGLADTPLYDLMPQARALVDSIPGEKHRVRLMRLAPGDGELTRHADITDPDSGTAEGELMRLHFPIVTNPGVLFRSWLPDGSQQEAHFPEGECWSLDTRKPHTAKNAGPTERVHLVVDVIATREILDREIDPAPVAASVAVWQPSEPAGTLEPWTLS